MENEPRKASDVLLDLESKIDQLLSLFKAHDLNIKIISNKLNELMKVLDKQPVVPPKITAEAVQFSAPTSNNATIFTQSPLVDPEKFIPILAESKLPQENSPEGFRRNSRPESYSKKKTSSVPDQPVGIPSTQMSAQASKPPPGRSLGDTVTAPKPVPKNKAAVPPTFPPDTPTETMPVNDHNTVPIEQRVVDGNNKSIFLADVEILDTTDNHQVFKTRTNGTGKWMAALPIGIYRVIIRKKESVTKNKVENIQTITVNGTTSPLKLPMVIIK